MSDEKKEKKKKRRRKVQPEDGSEEGSFDNLGFTEKSEQYMKNINSSNSAEKPSKGTNKFKEVARKSLKFGNGLQVIANVKKHAAKWKDYITSRRAMPESEDGDRRKTGGIGLAYELDQGGDSVDGLPEITIAHNRNLIEYFARVGSSKKTSENIDLEFVYSLLKSGANINCTDKYGQTIFHEVARAWHTDVAKFLLDHGADVNRADNFGRTPLHVAAAVDYVDMVNFLVQHGADKEALTRGEKQTPVHFAARNDACHSLRALIKAGCEYKKVRDYKGRTPLHVAAELDRSESARLLLELDDPAPAGVCDDSGQAAIVWMIIKMPPVAKLALDQLHTKDRANRKQFFWLQRLEPIKPGAIKRDVYPQTAHAAIVTSLRYDLVTHPVMEELVKVKWKRFGKLGAVIGLVINILFILAWSLQGILVEYDQRYLYVMPDQWWRIVLFILACFFTGWQLRDETTEFITSKKNHKNWKQWREAELDRDIEFSHPRWPEEEIYLQQEKHELDKIKPQYFSDFWNIFDWVCYMLLLVCIITHLVDIFQHTNFVARLHIRIMAVTIILIWLRLLKNARAFSYLDKRKHKKGQAQTGANPIGPFIVMLTHMLSDVVKFGFLYLEFFIPFSCAFWMLFGGDKTVEEFQGMTDSANHTVIVGGMGTVNEMLFSLFRLTLVDDYDFDTMQQVDSVMSAILVGAWLALSAILMLNLLIALLSDTFQRVYDNAQANAVMQKAITILNIEEGLSKKRRERFREFIHTQCSPKVDFYDDDAADDGGADLQKVTIQIKEQLDAIEHDLKEGNYTIKDESGGFKDDNDHPGRRRGGGGGGDDEDGDDGDDHKPSKKYNGQENITVEKFESEFDLLRDEIHTIRDAQEEMLEEFGQEIDTIKDLLLQLVSQNTGNHSAPPSVTSAAAVQQQAAGGSSEEPPPLTSLVGWRGVEIQPPESDWARMERERAANLDHFRTQLANHSEAPQLPTVNIRDVEPYVEQPSSQRGLVPVRDGNHRLYNNLSSSNA